MLEIRRLAKSTVKRRVISLTRFFDWTCAEGLREDNPVAALNIQIRLPDRLPRFLTRGEVRQLLDTPQCNVDVCELEEAVKRATELDRKVFQALSLRLIVELLFTTGMRVGELVALCCGDVCIEQRLIRLNGKGSRERNVFITDNGLVHLCNLYLSFRQRVGRRCKSLFLNSRENSITEQIIRAQIRSIADQAGIPKRVTPHMLRHTAATLLLESRVDIRFVQRLLGHRSIATTQLYAHVTDVSLRKVLEDANIRSVVSQSAT